GPGSAETRGRSPPGRAPRRPGTPAARSSPERRARRRTIDASAPPRAAKRPGRRRRASLPGTNVPRSRDGGAALLDLDRLTAGVVPTVRADPVRELRLVALGALGVGRRRGLPLRRTLPGRSASLLALGGGHVSGSAPLVRHVETEVG